MPVGSVTNVPQGTDVPAADERYTQENKPAAKVKPPQAGDHVGHYELIRLLGRGGMGSVFLARDNKLGRRVAIKFLHTQDADLTKRFVLEARTTARFSHENIVIIYEVDEHQGQPFMVLEYLQGQPLTQMISEGKGLPPARAVELMVPVVRALASAHAQSIVHRDLKFDNVFVTDSGMIKVLDFGIAKVLQGAGEQLPTQPSMGAAPAPILQPDGDDGTAGNSELTRHGTIMGTLAFMSPEQWRGVGIDNRADIWAAGIMLFRMLSGKHPLAPLTGMALSVTARLQEPMPKLHEAAPGLPLPLCEVVDRCLAKKKEDRWPDAHSLLRALEPFLPGRYTRELKIDESPYAGLSSFQEADADRFFGRSSEIAAVVNRIRDVPLVGIVGPSGTGKSSFVRAGIVPTLKRSGENWEALVIRPGRKPIAALADVVTSLVSTSSSVADDLKEQSKVVARLAQEPGYMGSVLRSRARREKRNILVFVDQFEELYTLVADAKERRTFTQCLASIADDATSPTRVVLSIRSDFLDRVPEDPSFMAELSKGLFFLTAPASSGLRDALVQPAEMAGYHFENESIVNDMLGHLKSTQGALPLLQFAASKLWESRDPTKKLLTQASYDIMGGIAGALAVHADSVLTEMSPQARTLARTLFLRLITPERTRAIVSIDELRELVQDAAGVQRIIDQLVQARLLVVQTAAGGSGASVEIVHESLLQTWPTLRRWLDESGEDAAFIEQLRTAAKQWQGKGHDAGLLWRGDVVDEARRFQKRYRGELPQLQKRFLAEVFAQEAKSARRTRILQVGSVAFLGLLAVAASVALVVIRSAQQESERHALEAIAASAQAKQAESAARDEAVRAQKAESEAKENLKAAQEKEAERAKAAEEAERARQEITTKNQELLDALNRAEDARAHAKVAQQGAEMSASEAKAAREEVARKAQQLQDALQKEQERAKRLQEQLGSPVIDTLK
jgi:serine/threonine protein kinase